jgi:uncharacterized protein (DUF736 family)
MSNNKPTHRVLIARDGKAEKLLEVGALWPGKNGSLSGEIDLIVGKLRLVVVPARERDQANGGAP